MKVFFYCSYQQSQKGFTMTQLAGQTLVSCTAPPKIVDEFFSYDRFRILWKDIVSPNERTWYQPDPVGSFFGIRNLVGAVEDGRQGYVNLAFMTEAASEIPALRRIALSILGDVAGFAETILSMIHIGGVCSYYLDGKHFLEWMAECTETSRLKLMIPKRDPAAEIIKQISRRNHLRIETDLLHFAVFSSCWKDVYREFGSNPLWRIKPAAAFTTTEFSTHFLERGPLWFLYSPVSSNPSAPENSGDPEVL